MKLAQEASGAGPALRPDPLPRFSGLFPEDDIPEKAHRKLQEGRTTKKRLPKRRLQNKTGGPVCRGDAPATVPRLASRRAPLLAALQQWAGPFPSLTCVPLGVWTHPLLLRAPRCAPPSLLSPATALWGHRVLLSHARLPAAVAIGCAHSARKGRVGAPVAGRKGREGRDGGVTRHLTCSKQAPRPGDPPCEGSLESPLLRPRPHPSASRHT